MLELLGSNVILGGFLGSMMAAGLTMLGALPVFFRKSLSVRAADILLGFSAGVMLAASFFSLMIPALDFAHGMFGSKVIAAMVAAVSILVGAWTVWALNTFLPHEHFHKGYEGPEAEREALARVWLFIIAITIHNFPEGLSIGVSFGTGNVMDGVAVATGIGLQDIPEGLAVAVALVGRGYSRGQAFFIAMLTGLVEPVAGLIGAAAVAVSQTVLPWGLAFASGAMLYVISHEIIPETHRHGHEKLATGGLMVGLVVMMFLDYTLG